MVTRIWILLVLMFAAAAWLPGQQGSVSGPTAGFVFDSSAHSLRPVMGVPGASVIGDPVKFDFDLAAASVAPAQDLAVAAAADGGLHIFRLVSGAVSERTVDGVSALPERVVFSPSGTAAALYAAGKAQILTGLPDAPVLAGSMDLGGTPSALALSDDGQYLLYAAGGSVQLISAGGNRKLMDAGDGAVVAFAPGILNAAVLDPGGAGVVLFRDLAGASQQTVVAAPDDGMASPVGLAFSAAGRKLLVASRSARSVSSFDLETGDRGAFPCNCVPTGFVSMGNLLRLNELGTDPLWLFDAGADDPRIVFVPAMAPPVVNF